MGNLRDWHDRASAGCDESWLQARAEEARRLAFPAIDRALDSIPGPIALHLCFGYAYVARDKRTA
jgi:5-methyltetrahydropteroyltriglutamate--homocysteine methyltransferase